VIAVCNIFCFRLIYGFISKDEAKRKLIDSPCGSFLLRFSESNIEQSQRSDISGYLTLAVMELDPNTGSLLSVLDMSTSVNRSVSPVSTTLCLKKMGHAHCAH